MKTTKISTKQLKVKPPLCPIFFVFCPIFPLAKMIIMPLPCAYPIIPSPPKKKHPPFPNPYKTKQNQKFPFPLPSLLHKIQNPIILHPSQSMEKKIINLLFLCLRLCNFLPTARPPTSMAFTLFAKTTLPECN